MRFARLILPAAQRQPLSVSCAEKKRRQLRPCGIFGFSGEGMMAPRVIRTERLRFLLTGTAGPAEEGKGELKKETARSKGGLCGQ
jgi:hypothetical protein